jgi:NADH dehydrogenase
MGGALAAALTGSDRLSERKALLAVRPLNVCVLGGTGFVGTELVSRLVRDGHNVRVPTRRLANGVHLKVLPTAQLVVANIHDLRTLGQLFGGMDVVVNLVGILNERGRATFRAVHKDLATKVIEAMRAQRVRRLLHMSSLAASAQAPSQYLRSKAEAEAQVRVAAATIDSTIFRPSVIFGEHDSLTNRFARLLRATHGFLPLARPHARFAPIFVDDLIEVFVRALADRSTMGKSLDLCGPDVMTLEELVRLTARAANLPCHILPLPDFVAVIQGVVMGMLPGKPFSTDNYKSLTIDSVCKQNGCETLGIALSRMEAVLPGYLSDHSLQTQLNRYRRFARR